MTSLGHIGAGSNVRMLPYDAEVEYLYRASTGDKVGPWIDTGVFLKNNPIIEMSVMPDAGSAFLWVAGCRRLNAPSCYCNMAINVSDGKVRAVYGTQNTSNEANFAFPTNKFSLFKMTKTTLSVDGVPVKTYSNKTVGSTFVDRGIPTCGIFTCLQTIYGDDRSDYFHSGGTAKIAWCKIWNDNGATLVFDGRAVRKNGEGYLFDSITNNLYGNAADTGAFVIGPDK